MPKKKNQRTSSRKRSNLSHVESASEVSHEETTTVDDSYQSTADFYIPTFLRLDSTPHIPNNLTQAMVEGDPALWRLQQDLLVLTSFCDNSVLYWRPSWFKQEPFSRRWWTLHNPPNVANERLHKDNQNYKIVHDRETYTRRLKDASEPRQGEHIKDWDHWARVCDDQGVPPDFLCAKHIEMIRLGLQKDKKGKLLVPPSFPLYPEPQPLDQGEYILDQATYKTHLPDIFKTVRVATYSGTDKQVVVVHSDGRLKVETLEYDPSDSDEFMKNMYPIMIWSGAGEAVRHPKPMWELGSNFRVHGKGRKWSHLP